MVLFVRRRIHWGIGRFCFCALASFCLVRKDFWLCGVLDYRGIINGGRARKQRTGIVTVGETVEIPEGFVVGGVVIRKRNYLHSGFACAPSRLVYLWIAYLVTCNRACSEFIDDATRHLFG